LDVALNRSFRDHYLSGAIASLHDMISKLQRVVCHLNDRLSTIEQMSGIAPPAIAPSTTGLCNLFTHNTVMAITFVGLTIRFCSSAQKG
jgi:hypothetical protein